jgi:hypothetical protein
MPGWRGEQAMEILEDAVPLHNIDLSIRLDKAPSAIRSAYSGNVMQFNYSNGRAHVRLDTVDLHELLVIED